MHTSQMKAMSGKELDYVVDSMSNEALLMKQCASTAALTQNPQIRAVCLEQVEVHKQHYGALMNCLEQHVGMAPQQFPGSN